MAPAQVLTDLDHRRKTEKPTKSVSEMENGNFSEIKDDVFLRCMNNCEDNTFDMDTLSNQKKAYEAGDEVVDILDCADNGARVTQDDPDATEYSSSFGNTTSGSDNGFNSNLSDAEVDSPNDGASILFNGFDSVFGPRKKKLTAHWRRYIRPLMWRCKWIELRLKEFQSQALKYDKGLSAYSHEKQVKLGQVGSENSAARLVPLSYQSNRKQVMKRRKRKKFEDTVDLPSYMSHHSLFSYYENKKSEADGDSIVDDCGNQDNAVDEDQNANIVNEFGIIYEWPVTEPKNGSNSLEQILWNIDILLSRVLKMKTQINKLVSTNARKFSLIENLSLFMSADLPTSCARNPTFSPGNGEEMPVGALSTPHGHISGYEIGELVIPVSAVSNFGEAASRPDIIESTVGLLSAADVSRDRPQIGDSCMDNDDDILILNQAAEEELQHFEVVIQPIDKPQEPAGEQKEKETVHPVLALEQCPAPDMEPDPEPVLGAKMVIATEPVLRSCLGSNLYVPKNKRKRANRRGGLSRGSAKIVYSRRSSRAKK